MCIYVFPLTSAAILDSVLNQYFPSPCILSQPTGAWIEVVLLCIFVIPLISAAMLGILSCVNALAQYPSHLASINRLLDLVGTQCKYLM